MFEFNVEYLCTMQMQYIVAVMSLTQNNDMIFSGIENDQK